MQKTGLPWVLIRLDCTDLHTVGCTRWGRSFSGETRWPIHCHAPPLTGVIGIILEWITRWMETGFLPGPRYACLGLFYRWDFNFCLRVNTRPRSSSLRVICILYGPRAVARGGLSILNSRPGCWLKFWDDPENRRVQADHRRSSIESLLYRMRFFFIHSPRNSDENGDLKLTIGWLFNTNGWNEFKFSHSKYTVQRSINEDFNLSRKERETRENSRYRFRISLSTRRGYTLNLIAKLPCIA